MVKPVLKGTAYAVRSEKKSFKNRTSGVEETYVQHSVDLLCSEPEKGVATVKVYANGETISIKEGTSYCVALSSFQVEKGAALYVADEKAFIPTK